MAFETEWHLHLINGQAYLESEIEPNCIGTPVDGFIRTEKTPAGTPVLSGFRVYLLLNTCKYRLQKSPLIIYHRLW